MGRAHQGHSYGRAFWQHVVAEWQRRGESAAACARRVEVSKASLFRWRELLAREATARPPAFVPVDVVPDRVGAGVEAGAVDVVLANGRRLRCGAGTDPAWLAQLAAALERPAC